MSGKVKHAWFPLVTSGCCLALVLLSASGTSAQATGQPQLRWTLRGVAKGGFGAAIASLGDLNADSAPEFIVGTPWHGFLGGRATVHSGANGGGVESLDGFCPTECIAGFGSALASIGPGRAAVGAPFSSLHQGVDLYRAGQVLSFSVDGAGVGQLLWWARGSQSGADFGAAVATWTDLNSDTVPELVVGAPATLACCWRASVHFLDGATGRTLRVVNGEQSGGPLYTNFGRALAMVGDVDGDSSPELLIGAPTYKLASDPPQSAGRGKVFLYSFAKAQFLWTYEGATAEDVLGHAVAGVGDVNGDSVPDVAVGLPGGSASGQLRKVEVLSGSSGAPLWSVTGDPTLLSFATSLAALRDLNGDGASDLVVGGSKPAVLSGKSGDVLFELDLSSVVTPAELRAGVGNVVANVGDLDRNQVDDIAIGGAPYGYGDYDLSIEQMSALLDGKVLVFVLGIPLDLTPRIAYWPGKVNQHTEQGVWKTDPDGVSGANIDPLVYCRKWYPNTVSVQDYKMETITDWKAAGNTGSYVGTKMSKECKQQ